MTTTFDVEKMFCKGCAKHVIEAVQAVQAGAEVNIDLATGKVEVSPSPDDPAALIKAIAEAGYVARLGSTAQNTENDRSPTGGVMDEDFLARRSVTRARLDAMNPHLKPDGDPNDPTGDRWFSTVYDLAGDDPAKIPWAALAPNRLLNVWLSRQGALSGKRALDVGCGLGDNAEALAAAGAQVTAFDYVDRAIVWAKQRFPESRVEYRTADLLEPPKEWSGVFDLVHECYTLQALNPDLFSRAAHALASFVAPGGLLVVITSAREEGEPQTTPYRPLTRAEIESLAVDGLVLKEIDDIPQEGCVTRRFRAIFRHELAVG